MSEPTKAGLRLLDWADAMDGQIGLLIGKPIATCVPVVDESVAAIEAEARQQERDEPLSRVLIYEAGLRDGAQQAVNEIEATRAALRRLGEWSHQTHGVPLATCGLCTGWQEFLDQRDREAQR